MRTHGCSPAFVALVAAALLFPACNGNEGGEGALEAYYGLEIGDDSTPLDDSPLHVCCEDGVIATLNVGEVAVLDGDGNVIPAVSFPSQFEGPPPVPGTRYLGFSLADVDPPGALSFRWDGPFVADLHREENPNGQLLPFDPDVDVGEPAGYLGDGYFNRLEVSAARCDFETASFTMIVFEFSYLASPTQGAGILIYRTRERTVEIENDCFTPGPGPAGDHIVFSNRPPSDAAESDSEIWTMELGTGVASQLTDNQQIEDVDPTWSPDRSLIAFVSNRTDPSGIDFDLVVMDQDGNDQEALTDLGPQNQSADDPAWSPVTGERRIVFTIGQTGFGGKDIWILDLDEPESSPDRLRQLTTGGNNDTSPTWSPDGQEIAFIREGVIHVVPAAGGAPSQLYSPPNGNDSVSAIDWGPSGIVLDLYVFAASRSRLARIDDSGGSLADVTAGGTHIADATPSWATTSDSAVFVRQGEATSRLFTVAIDDGGPNEAQEIAGQPDGENQDPDCGSGPQP